MINAACKILLIALLSLAAGLGCSSSGDKAGVAPLMVDPTEDGYFRLTPVRRFPMYCSRARNQCARINEELQLKLIKQMCVADPRFVLKPTEKQSFSTIYRVVPYRQSQHEL